MQAAIKASKPSLKVNGILKKEIILSTEYGRLSVLHPLLNSSQKIDSKNSITVRDITYINNNSSVSSVFALINRQKDYFLFRPESHYYNSTLLFQSIRKKVHGNFYGDKENMKNPFENCKSPKDVFNLSRNIKMSIKKELSRFGIKLYSTGELDIKLNEQSFMKSNIMFEDILKKNIKKHESEVSVIADNNIKFNKHEYFISMEMLEGLLTVLKYSQKGINVSVLGDKKIYPMAGVFSPTREDYLNLLLKYVQENYKELKGMKALDLGCGSGILSFILADQGLRDITAVDINENAVMSCKNNAESLGYFDIIKTRKLNIFSTEDIQSLVKANSGKQQLFDIIVCNPPWLNANFVFSQNEFENAIYDPKYKFLEHALKEGSKVDELIIYRESIE